MDRSHIEHFSDIEAKLFNRYNRHVNMGKPNTREEAQNITIAEHKKAGGGAMVIFGTHFENGDDQDRIFKKAWLVADKLFRSFEYATANVK